MVHRDPGRGGRGGGAHGQACQHGESRLPGKTFQDYSYLLKDVLSLQIKPPRFVLYILASQDLQAEVPSRVFYAPRSY